MLSVNLAECSSAWQDHMSTPLSAERSVCHPARIWRICSSQTDNSANCKQACYDAGLLTQMCLSSHTLLHGLSKPCCAFDTGSSMFFAKTINQTARCPPTSSNLTGLPNLCISDKSLIIQVSHACRIVTLPLAMYAAACQRRMSLRSVHQS